MMLNDAEKNCSRYEQQNKFLKEDIRRLQRSVDRHAEIQNMEYLKNIILKVFCSVNLYLLKYYDYFLFILFIVYNFVKWSRKISLSTSNKQTAQT